MATLADYTPLEPKQSSLSSRELDWSPLTIQRIMSVRSVAQPSCGPLLVPMPQRIEAPPLAAASRLPQSAIPIGMNFIAAFVGVGGFLLGRPTFHNMLT